MISLMRLSHRMAASAVAITASFLFFLSHLQNEKARQERDIEFNSQLLSESLRESVEPLLRRDPEGRLDSLVEKFGHRGRFAGMAVFDRHQALAVTGSLRSLLASPPKLIAECLRKDAAVAAFERIGKRGLYINALPLHRREKLVGVLATFHDTSYIDVRLARLWRSNIEHVVIQMLLFIVVLIALRKLFH